MRKKTMSCEKLASLSVLFLGASLLVLGCGKKTEHPRSGVVPPADRRDVSAVNIASPATPKLPRKHIILFIGDGMQLADEMVASRYLLGKDQGLSFHSLDYKAHVTTFSVSSYNRAAEEQGRPPYNEADFDPAIGYAIALGGAAPYPIVSTAEAESYLRRCPATDSGAAMTAMMTGHKTDNGKISFAPGENSAGDLETIAEQLRQQRGFAVGMVSSMPFNHATPACVMAHNQSRWNYCATNRNPEFNGLPLAEEIAQQAKPDVVISGGHPVFAPGYVTDALYRELKESTEYIFVERVAGESGAQNLADAVQRATKGSHKLFGLFGDEKRTSFGVRLPVDKPGEPGFEVNPENPSLAEAVLGALEILAADPQGFLLMSEQSDIDRANHANTYNYMIGAVTDLDAAVHAALEFVERPGDALDWTNTLLIVTADHACGHLRWQDEMKLGKGDLPRQLPPDEAGAIIYPDSEISYGKKDHTNELVMIYAKGSGVPLLRKHEGAFYPGYRIIDNTHIYSAMAEFAGIRPESIR